VLGVLGVDAWSRAEVAQVVAALERQYDPFIDA